MSLIIPEDKIKQFKYAVEVSFKLDLECIIKIKDNTISWVGMNAGKTCGLVFEMNTKTTGEREFPIKFVDFHKIIKPMEKQIKISTTNDKMIIYPSGSKKRTLNFTTLDLDYVELDKNAIQSMPYRNYFTVTNKFLKSFISGSEMYPNLEVNVVVRKTHATFKIESLLGSSSDQIKKSDAINYVCEKECDIEVSFMYLKDIVKIDLMEKDLTFYVDPDCPLKVKNDLIELYIAQVSFDE